MAKLRMTLEQKDEVRNPKGGLFYNLRLSVNVLTTDGGAVIAEAAGEVQVNGLTGAQAAGLATGTVFNCPVQT